MDVDTIYESAARLHEPGLDELIITHWVLEHAQRRLIFRNGASCAARSRSLHVANVRLRSRAYGTVDSYSLALRLTQAASPTNFASRQMIEFEELMTTTLSRLRDFDAHFDSGFCQRGGRARIRAISSAQESYAVFASPRYSGVLYRVAETSAGLKMPAPLTDLRRLIQ